MDKLRAIALEISSLSKSESNNPSLSRLLTYAAAGGAALIVVGVATCYLADREASRNLARCKTIRPGALVADLTRQLTGADFYRYDGRETWVSFNTSRFASERIKARYDSSTGRVLELNCANEDRAEWSLEPSIAPPS